MLARKLETRIQNTVMGIRNSASMERHNLPNKIQEIINENKSIPFLLNPFFRIQKNCEESQSMYSNLKSTKPNKKRILRTIFKVPYFIIKIISYFVGSLFYVKQLKHFEATKYKSDTLFISHATNSNIEAEKDLFFGDLLKLFDKKSCAILYLNHTRRKHSKILMLLRNKQLSQNVFLMPKFLHPLEIVEYLGAITELLINHLKLAKTYKGIDNAKTEILIESIPWIFSRETYNNYNLVRRGVELQKKHEIKQSFLTFEGYNYEELLANEFIIKDNNINLYFYQHSPLTKAHIGIQLFLKNFHTKVCILTTGPAYSKFLLGLSSKSEIICVGSTKVTKPIKKFETDELSILMAPEGSTIQTIKFLIFTLQIARAFPNVTFIFRLHPNVVLTRSARKFILSLESLDNAEVSRESLMRDISRTKATMYTGSVVAIEALNSKNLPIFVNFQDNLELDVFSIGNIVHPTVSVLNFKEEFSLILKSIDVSNRRNFESEILYQKFKAPKKLIKLLKA